MAKFCNARIIFNSNCRSEQTKTIGVRASAFPCCPGKLSGTFYHFVYGDHESGTHFANRWNVFTAIECPLSGSKECASDKFLLT